MQSQKKTSGLAQLQTVDDAEPAYFYGRRYANGAITIHVDGLSAVPDDVAVNRRLAGDGLTGRPATHPEMRWA
jgi:hypothetical protein